MHLKLDNLFNGDKLLGDSTNKFLDENWKDIFSELQPAIIKTLEIINLSVPKPVFDAVPYSELYDNVMMTES